MRERVKLMKHIFMASAALAALNIASATADGLPTPSKQGTWYIGGSAGMNWVGNTDPATFFNFSLDTDFDAGWALMGNVGYRWSDESVRTELELGYRDNNVGGIVHGGAPLTNADGELEQFSLMVNVLYDIPLANDIALTLGGGIGGARTNFNASGGGDIVIVDSGDDWAFAYQGIAGLSYAVSRQTDIFVEYRYLVNPSHDIVTYPPPNVPRAESVDFDNQTVAIGFRFAFNPA